VPGWQKSTGSSRRLARRNHRHQKELRENGPSGTSLVFSSLVATDRTKPQEESMAHIRWQTTFDPFRGLLALEDGLQKLFEAGPLGDGAYPAVSLEEDADALRITAEVPGVPLEALTVEVKGDRLTIAGERKASDTAAERYHRRERRTGAFSRVVTLPARVDAAKIEASLKDGILRIRLPKEEAAKARRVPVSQG
jgi:HSP20 family protein